VTTTGAGSYGFLAQGSAGATNTLQIGSATISSAADAFCIQGTHEDITVNGSSVFGNNSLLLTTAAPATAPEEPLPPPTLPDPIPPDSGPSAGDPSFPADSRPEVAPQVPAYLSTPRALFETNFLDIDSLHRRLGEIRDDQTLSYDPEAETFVRVYGGLLNCTTNRSFQAFGYDFSPDYSAVQFGTDWMLVRNDDGTLRIGLAGTLGRLWMQPSAIDGESKALFDTGASLASPPGRPFPAGMWMASSWAACSMAATPRRTVARPQE